MTRRKNLCNICEILRYQNLAMKDAKYQYQVTRYLKLAQTARNRIIKKSKFYDNGADVKGYYCTPEHNLMAVNIVMQHDILLQKLSTYREETRKRKMNELQKLAFKYAEDVIIYGVNSIEALQSRMELDRLKHNLGVRKPKKGVGIA